METRRQQFIKKKIKKYQAESDKSKFPRKIVTESSAIPSDTEVTVLGSRSYLEQNQDLLTLQSAPAEKYMQVEDYKQDVSY